MKKAVAYYRVSTKRQLKDWPGHDPETMEKEVTGLGLEAQQMAVERFAVAQGYDIAAEYTEVESGRKNKRPQLLTALTQCRKERATLIIAKLDRLGRNVAFISNLMESKVEFKAVDNPHASRVMLHMLAAFAEHEAEQIGTRTKEALAAAKRRGIVLGKNGRVLGKKNKIAADQFAEIMRPIIDGLKAEGFITIRSIRDELNSRNVPTYRNNGQKWHIPNVFALLKRIY
ncbi:recombinase family protein [Dyadobacter psychrotolerans]|uniref:Recombinase family protein n=1 Tax=Dyadobacter psychrotolerans TaxID=2541721 RepID=A0A4R5D8K0_9BACT|nr:recombinase family protein [Dyadobacter psychrotolerans]TDE08061.1 recombinase family protein [Dyadobacter psychrotolerans]